ncbi:MAG: pyruvate, phosphate dikinase [Candidatus Bathyarchaeia archaeon]
MEKWIYSFEEGDKDMRDLLGGKGANLAEMTRLGLRVPPGFTITTDTCKTFFENRGKFPEGLWEQILEYVREVEEKTEKNFGDPENPLLVSVRSGAPVSMPGMMDTVLNLGLNDDVVEGLARLTGDRRFAFDAYRRLITMFADVVMGADRQKFDEVLEEEKAKRGVERDADLDAEALEEVVRRQKVVFKEEVGRDFPKSPLEQLRLAVAAVFNSWNIPRAVAYRKIERIPDDMGTACNIQTMVFGNRDWDSGSGVLFTRNPANGEPGLYGELLFNAQGEDVVAGIRTPLSVEDLKEMNPGLYGELEEVSRKLEEHYRDMQDIEFTIESGTLYILQTRTGKRTTRAAVKIAVDMAKEGLIDEKEALLRIDPNEVERLLHKTVDPNAERNVIAKGLPASPGAAVGRAVFDPMEAEEWAEKGERVILVRPETTPEDIRGMAASEGILTSRGGMTSHAAIVARGMGKPAVVGCEELDIDLGKEEFSARGITIRKGEVLTIEGLTGEVMVGEAPLVEPKVWGEFEELLSWADKYRRLGVWANANDEDDARRALEYGAEGIGLARTERMFLGVERVALVRAMVMADTAEDRRKVLEELLPMQKEDFKRILRVMDGKPVQIRLLDPPLHEFLPKVEEILERVYEMEKSGADPEKIEEEKLVLAKLRKITEANPMIGLRMCRIGIIYPEIYEAQARAIFEAASELVEEDLDPRPEIMIPGSIVWTELSFIRELAEKARREVAERHGFEIAYRYGTMIEIPRAALTADEIAKEVEFFSFGTNDLTQTGLGLSRDDAQGTFLPIYIDKQILDRDPFQTLDVKGVGKLVDIGVKLGRSTNKELKIGICGEHGGDPDSIYFFHKVGLDYVSCSPFRIPIARLAAAVAALREESS